MNSLAWAGLAVCTTLLWGCEEPVAEVVGITIAIDENPAGTDCDVNVQRWLTFTPDPSSVAAGDFFRWENRSTRVVTIVGLGIQGADATPYETVAPGEVGAFLSFDAASIFRYAAQGCHLGFQGAGTLNVTAGFAP